MPKRVCVLTLRTAVISAHPRMRADTLSGKPETTDREEIRGLSQVGETGAPLSCAKSPRPLRGRAAVPPHRRPLNLVSWRPVDPATSGPVAGGIFSQPSFPARFPGPGCVTWSPEWPPAVRPLVATRSTRGLAGRPQSGGPVVPPLSASSDVFSEP